MTSDANIRRELKIFYNKLQPRPLDPDDPFYEAYIERQGSLDGDPIADLAQKINWSEAATLSMLSGQRGSGKSTQLRRLKKILENEGYTVLLCDMVLRLNLSMPLEITDFLISLMAALSKEVRAQFNENPAERTFWDRLKQLLNSEVKLGIKFEAELDPVTFGIDPSLKNDPDFKQTMQKALKGHVSWLVQQVWEYADGVVDLVRQREKDPNRKVVLIADSIEQLRGDESVHKSVEVLFAGQGENLRFPKLHTVYTVPPYLIPLAPGLDRNLGATLRTLPSVHVRKRNGEDDPNGLEVLRHMVSRRYARWPEVFDQSQIDEMARSTGGDLRDFFRMIGEALVLSATRNETFPVSQQVIDSAKHLLKRAMMPLANDDMRWLSRIAETKTPDLPSIEKLPSLARLFDSHLVLNYRNGDDWYDVHPLLLDEVNHKDDSL